MESKGKHISEGIFYLLGGVVLLSIRGPEFLKAVFGEWQSYQFRAWNIVVTGSEALIVGGAYILICLLLVFFGLRGLLKNGVNKNP